MSSEITDSVLEVLLYLFENYIRRDVLPKEVEISIDLKRAGFTSDDIEGALRVLESLNNLLQMVAERCQHTTQSATRVFTTAECRKLDVDCRGFLLFLEQLEILSLAIREWIIERAMSLEADEIGLYDLKDIILMGLYQQSAQNIFMPTRPVLDLPEMVGRMH